jgi:hypothetical protein
MVSDSIRSNQVEQKVNPFKQKVNPFKQKKSIQAQFGSRTSV